LTYAQVLAHTYVTVKFQLRSSINVRLTESSLYNRFCIERSPKMGIFRAGRRYLIGTPRNAITTDLRRLMKNFGDVLNTLICMRGKEEVTPKKRVRQQDIYLAIRPAYPRGCCPRAAKGDKTYLQPVFLHR